MDLKRKNKILIPLALQDQAKARVPPKYQRLVTTQTIKVETKIMKKMKKSYMSNYLNNRWASKRKRKAPAIEWRPLLTRT